MKKFLIDYPISNHEKEIITYFNEENVLNTKEYQKNQFNIFICFTNRCGSNFLADVLASTNFFPHAGEFFNWDTVIRYSQNKQLHSFDDYCLNLIEHTQKNKFFISKIGWQQLILLSKFGQIPNIFDSPKFIWIRRKDILSQAVSLSIANQTKKWASFQAETGINPEYRKNEILTIIKGFNEENLMFTNYFNLFNASVLEIVYEDFCDNLEPHVKKIFKFADQKFHSPNLDKIHVKIQRDEINEEFKTKFLTDIKEEFSLQKTT
jgi:trehalose 2-sulfotransferase